MINWLCVMNSMLMNFLLWNYVLWKYVYEWQNKFLWQVFKVSYQSSDLREVMFRLKGTYDGKYETMGDIGRSLPLISLCLRALVRHGAHMNKFDKFSKNEFLRNNWWICVMLLSLWMCIFYTTTLVLAEQKLTLYVRVTGNKGKQPVNSQ